MERVPDVEATNKCMELVSAIERDRQAGIVSDAVYHDFVNSLLTMMRHFLRVGVPLAKPRLP